MKKQCNEKCNNYLSCGGQDDNEVSEIIFVVSHARPFEPYPKLVLGAVSSFLEPFRGHLSPKVIQIFKK